MAGTVHLCGFVPIERLRLPPAGSDLLSCAGGGGGAGPEFLGGRGREAAVALFVGAEVVAGAVFVGGRVRGGFEGVRDRDGRAGGEGEVGGRDEDGGRGGGAGVGGGDGGGGVVAPLGLRREGGEFSEEVGKREEGKD